MNRATQSASDPYQDWLGIPPGPRPPDHYTLLGLPRLESDLEKIRTAIRERVKLVRPRCLRFPEEGTRLLNEIATAEVCLLNAERAAEYRKTLEAQNPEPSRDTTPDIIPFQADEPAAPASTPFKSPARVPVEPRRSIIDGERSDPSRKASPRRSEPDQPAAHQRWALAAGLGGTALLLILGLTVFLSGKPNASTPEGQVAENSPPSSAADETASSAPVSPEPPPEPKLPSPTVEPKKVPEATPPVAPAPTPPPQPVADSTPDLIRELRDRDPLVRRTAAEKLGKVGPNSLDAAIRALAAAMEEDDPAIAEAVPASLKLVVGKDLTSLRNLVLGRHAKARLWAFRALKDLGPEAQPVLAFLPLIFADQDPDGRLAIVECVQAMATSDPNAVQVLGAALKDAEQPVRSAALRAVNQLELEAAVRALAAGLDSAKEEAALPILDRLILLGRGAGSALPAVLGHRNAESRVVRCRVAVAYAKILPSEASFAVAIVLPLVKDPASDVRKRAARALGQVGGDTLQVALELGNLLKDREPEVRLVAAEALWEIKPQNPQVDSKMIEGLEDLACHQYLVAALANRGKTVVPMLSSALNHRQTPVRLGTARILGELGPDAFSAYQPLRLRWSVERDPDVKQAIRTTMDLVSKKPTPVRPGTKLK